MSPGTPVALEVTKRDGRKVEFVMEKITTAISKAFAEVNGGVTAFQIYEQSTKLTSQVLQKLNERAIESPTVEGIQDIVEEVLIENNYAAVAKAYILYRDKRSRIRHGKMELMDIVGEIIEESNRDNANVGNSPSAKLLQIAEAASKQYYLNRTIPEDQSNLHINGDLYINDLSWFGKTLTCLQIPLGKLLKNGFDTGHGYIRSPKSIKSAGALSAIIMQSTQNDLHGGVAFAYFDRDLSTYVHTERERQVKKVTKMLKKLGINDYDPSKFQEVIDENVQDETWQAMEGFVYNLNSMHSRAGAQIPFSSINLGTDITPEGRMITYNFLKAYEAGLGKGESPIFPNVCFKLKKGVSMDPGDPNYDLFQLAMQVACKRLQPNFSFQDSSFNKPFNVNGEEVPYMGCRTRVMANINGDAVADGRGNLSFNAVNLPRLGIKANGDMEVFWASLEDLTRKACNQLYTRYLVQKELKVKDFPFLMGEHLYMDSDGLQKQDTIEKAIKNGTLSCGFVGLAECLYALTGKHHGESEEVQELGLKIISRMREIIDEIAQESELNFTLLATPAESVAGRLLKLDQKQFGIIKGVTDKEWYTNSFHVPVEYKTTGFNKIKTEGPYHKLCNAGHIGYVELSEAPSGNIDAFEQILRYMADCDFGYGAVNFPVDICKSCGFNGLIPERCPRCGAEDISRVRRITGYLSTLDMFNDSKKAEVASRVTHM